jgi:hypothetical protein
LPITIHRGKPVDGKFIRGSPFRQMLRLQKLLSLPMWNARAPPAREGSPL